MQKYCPEGDVPCNATVYEGLFRLALRTLVRTVHFERSSLRTVEIAATFLRFAQ